MEPEGTLPLSQEPATCPHSEPAESTPHTLTILLRQIAILSYHLLLGLESCHFPLGYWTKNLHVLLTYRPYASHPHRSDHPNNIW